MSKINAIRFINLNYNNNAIKISDETFHLNGESTLLSLRNGGGKSVLVQMITAPFVHKRYRDAKDRPFESYFTTGKPTFILVEWALDQGAGYVLTGMMVRKSQNMEADQTDNLDMVNFVSEYRSPCLTDLHHLPVVEREKKKMTLKNFADCKRMFEEFKRDNSFHFYCYDMTNSAQSRQYFDKLLEYQINYKEWETIIKKVNLEESGLSNLFSDCKDERGLVEKWFLEAIEGKLNREKNRMKEFQTIVEKYVGQYKDNRSKIKRRDTIRLFGEESLLVEEAALHYQQAEEKKKNQENRIGGFIQNLSSCREVFGERYGEVLQNLDKVEQAFSYLRYEQLSDEYYQYEKEQRFHVSNRDMIEAERDELEREQKETEKRLSLLFCARQQETVRLEQAEYDEARQKLEVFHRKDEDMAPEREFLGYMLREHYEKRLVENKEEQKEVSGRIEELEQELKEQKNRAEETEKKIRENTSLEGSLKTSVKSYDIQEERFNARYKEKFTRNILGDYEPGLFDIKREMYQKSKEDETRNQTKRSRQLEELKEQMKGLERDLKDRGKEKQQKIWEREQQEEVKKGYEEELLVRSSILKYLDLGEEERFNTDKILGASDRKLSEISRLKRTLEQEEDVLQKEYRKLTEGKVLELPGQLEQEFDTLGIPVVYGMEWLKKNGHTQEQNRKIVEAHPFLPYALILSKRELEKLSAHPGDTYTSVPIPIVKREELEHLQKGERQGVLDFPGISFYVYFNENLLNEEKLAVLVREKEEQIQRKKEAVSIRDLEYKEYFERRETVRCQWVSREAYEENERLLSELNQQTESLAKEIQKMTESLAEAGEERTALEDAIRQGERGLAHLERQFEDFEQLYQAYREYEENRKEWKGCLEELSALEEKRTFGMNRREHLKERLRITRIEQDRLLQEEKELRESGMRYAEYDKMPRNPADQELSALDITAKEARFKAITSTMSRELLDLEEQEQKALKRFQAAGEELKRLKEKYQLTDGEWLSVDYNPKEETHLEIRLEDGKKKLEVKNFQWNDENTKIAVTKSQMENCKKQIVTECRKEGPLAKEMISGKDFEAEKNRLLYRKGELKKEGEGYQERLQSYDENLTALAEYSDFASLESLEEMEDLTELDRRQLRTRKGILVRDYKELLEKCRNTKEKLTQVLNRMARKEEFADNYYKKPIETMLELTEDAGQVLQQLHITLQSYQDLMRKLEVDISVVEKEKEKIVELMEEYVKDVHVNLGKIDDNSTIIIRERPLKMLKIQLPDWEENENLYHLKLQDMIDGITSRGIEIFEQNGNAQEYFGTRLNTKTMYDTVIGISNVQIKLYKIEEQREYPITWADVAKNSGGEGFLSAFVILSSLLYYMRRDDTDLFADRNEGKVLVMDNPFAQTNAAHLLKPLMDMAGKANTQLICLTGLGGESIYNRFDNIYVMNLIAASLRNGMQYLKVDHIKGDEPEEMVLSRIEVTEQMSLEF